MCGISAVSLRAKLTKTQLRIAKNKLKILGIYNNSRGHHGCGMLINNEIIKGWNQKATNGKDNTEFKDFIANVLIPDIDITKSSVAIIHSRQSTGGVHSEENNHPFRIINETNPENSLDLVHNGVVRDWVKLCNKYEVDHTDINVDSKGFATVLSKIGTTVLEEYDGEAAFIWKYHNDPNSLFIFHGGNYTTEYNKKNNVTTEERPMYYLEAEEGVFFSSLEESLNAIKDNEKQKVECLIFNKVIKITNGIFQPIVAEYDRWDKNFKTYTPHTNYNVSQNTNYNMGESFGGTTTRGTIPVRNYNKSTSVSVMPPTSSIINDELPLNKDKNSVSFYRGRYRYEDGIVCHGTMFIKSRGEISTINDMHAEAYWFWDGIMLKSCKDYEILKTLNNSSYSFLTNKCQSNYADNISRYSQHPVCNIDDQASKFTASLRYAWYFEYLRVGNSKFRPYWSSRCYVIENAYLKEIIPSHKTDVVFKEKKVKDSLDIFDFKPNKVVDFFNYLTSSEIGGCRLFLKEKLTEFYSGANVMDHEITEALNILLLEGIDQNKTFREIFEDKDNQIEVYIDIFEFESKKDSSLNILDADLPFSPISKSVIHLPKSSQTELFEKDISVAIVQMEEEENQISKEIMVEEKIDDMISLVNELSTTNTELKELDNSSIVTGVNSKVNEFIRNLKVDLLILFGKNKNKFLEKKITQVEV